MEWYGAKGLPSIRTPATVKEWVNQEVSQERENVDVYFSMRIVQYPDGTVVTEVDVIIIVKGEGNLPYRIVHITTPLPEEGEGRDTQQAFSSEALTAKIKEVCCGRPKPFPPVNLPWPVLLREDFVVGFVPYDNPRIRQATSIDELVDQDIGFVWMRKRKGPFPPGPTDCGPNRVWCPPEQDPLMNIRLVREDTGSYAIQLRRLGESAPLATLPVTVDTVATGTEPSIDITDQYDPATKKPMASLTITIGIVRVTITIEV